MVSKLWEPHPRLTFSNSRTSARTPSALSSKPAHQPAHSPTRLATWFEDATLAGNRDEQPGVGWSAPHCPPCLHCVTDQARPNCHASWLLVARADLVLGDLPRTLTHLSGQSVFALLFRAGQPRRSPTRLKTVRTRVLAQRATILMRVGCRC